MKRIFSLALTAMLCAGCRSPAPVYDPFLGRTTVEPPGTALPPPGQPYYGAPAGATIAPPLVTPPTTISPTVPAPVGPSNFTPAPAGSGGLSSFAPNVSPTSPGALPSGPATSSSPQVTPVSNKPRPIYGPPGGLGYPQAGPASQNAAPSTVQVNPPKALDVDRIVGTPIAAANSTPTSPPTVVPATHWESRDDSQANQSPPASFTSPASSPSIRIVEPSGSAIRNSSPTGAGATAGVTSIPGNASLSTLNQSFAQSRSVELADLPPVTRAAPNSFIVASAAVPASNSPVRAPSPTPAARTLPTQGASLSSNAWTGASTSELPKTSYGFDPQYRWLKGKLEYSQSTRTWRLRYIPADATSDSFGGSVILPDAAKLNGFNAGDFVVVQGTVGRAAGDQSSFAPQYNLDRIQKQ